MPARHSSAHLPSAHPPSAAPPSASPPPTGLARSLLGGLGALGALKAVVELVDLALPHVCAACGEGSGPLCPTCGADLDSGVFDRPRRVRPDPVPPHLPEVVAAGPYDGVLRTLVSAYKDEERRDLRRVLARLLAGPLAEAVGAGPGALVVPTPSSRAAVRRRGDDPVADLARAAARLVSAEAGHGRPLVVAPALRPVRRLADQSGLDHRQRAANLAGAYAVRARWAARLEAVPVVLVDDVVTTGATLAEAARAVRAAGGQVVGAATLAATHRRRGAART